MNKFFFLFIPALFLITYLLSGKTSKAIRAEKFATTLGIVYVGMDKEALYKVYTPLQQKNYRKIGNEEWIEFSDWMTDKPGGKITFYLRDGLVKGWDK